MPTSRVTARTGFASLFKQSWRFLLRDWRSGELNLLSLALIISVAAITTVGFFISRVEAGINQQASELLAADFVISSREPISGERLKRAREMGLLTTQLMEFRSAVVEGDKVQLVEVKAVGEGYPLRGKLKVSERPYGEDRAVSHIVPRGEAWVEPRLLQTLGLDMGDAIQLGQSRFRITQVVSYEPDRGGDFFSLAPRVMINRADVPQTDLIQPGSRVKYRLLVAGASERVQQFVSLVKDHKRAGEQFVSVREGRPEIRFAFERADRFLNLVTLVSVLLGSVAIAMAAQRYTRRHIDTVAIMRASGVKQNAIFSLFAMEMLWFALLTSLVGCAVGYGAQFILTNIMSDLIVGTIPPPQWYPVITGMVTGALAVFGFVLPPLWLLRQTPPVRVLRRDVSRSTFRTGLVVVLVAALFVIWFWRLGDATVVAYTLGGTIATLAILYLIARVVVWALTPLRSFVGMSWRYGLANMVRRSSLSSLQITAFGLGIMVILLISLMRNELLGSWRQSLPPGTPNFFLVNIQNDQVEGIRAFFEEHAIESPRFYPMVRGRLTAINGNPVNEEQFVDPRAKRLTQRAFNLSWMDELQRGNVVVEGTWWGENPANTKQLSLDEDVANAFNVGIGDRMSFDVAGTEFTLTIDNLRSIDWDTFQVNFFALVPTGLLDDYPANWVTSLYMPVERSQILVELVRAYPNITLLDVDAIITRIRSIMDRVTLAIEFLLIFTFAVGVIIMLTAIRATQDARQQETALLLTLGAKRGWVLKGVITEYATIGAIAGGMGGMAAITISYLLAVNVFKFDYLPTPTAVVLGLVFGTLLIGLVGVLGANKILKQPPIQTFRKI